MDNARNHHNSNAAVTVFDEVFRIEHLVSIAKIYQQKIAFYWKEDQKRIQNLGARKWPTHYTIRFGKFNIQHIWSEDFASKKLTAWCDIAWKGGHHES